jgi:trimethylamine:corrinoid methyltransferase-like protein
MDRQAWEGWEAAGSLTMNQRINAKLRRILSTHKPLPLPVGASGKIEAILRSAEAREAKK